MNQQRISKRAEPPVMPDPFHPFLEREGFAVLDGALATELERRGAELRDPLWSAKLLLEDPALIRQVHYDYFAAGADVATTATYQATFAGFAARGIDAARAAELMRLSVRLAQEGREEFWSNSAHRARRLRPLVAASIGCYGASLHDGSEYRGDYGVSQRELMDFHRPRLEVLATSGADLIAFETIPCQIEGEAILRLVEEFPGIPAWLSFSCRDEGHVCHGEPFADCVALANEREEIVAVGLNCTAPRLVESLLHAARSATKKPLLAYPNSGESWDQATWRWRPGAGVDFAEAAPRWLAAGARLIGGCCRTTPDDIRRIAQALTVC
jgi:homocysteine S-methyltransferase